MFATQRLQVGDLAVDFNKMLFSDRVNRPARSITIVRQVEGAGTLALQLDTDRTPAHAIEQQIRALGYTTVGAAAGPAAGAPKKRAHAKLGGRDRRRRSSSHALFVLAQFFPAWHKWLYSVPMLLSNETIDALIALRNEPREDAAECVKRVTHCGLRVVILTGDNRCTGDAIAGQLRMEARAKLLPDAKPAEIGRLKAAGLSPEPESNYAKIRQALLPRPSA